MTVLHYSRAYASSARLTLLLLLLLLWIGIVLCLLCGCCRHEPPANPGNDQPALTREQILAACDASLRRLQTSYIDLYQIHCECCCRHDEGSAVAVGLALSPIYSHVKSSLALQC